MAKLAEQLKRLPARRQGPVWQGPESDGDQGGVTQSMLSRFLCCKERFRLKVIEGLEPHEGFNHRLEYGQMWHTCEEALAEGGQRGQGLQLAMHRLQMHCQALCRRYPTQQQDVDKWYNVCKIQFPIYVDFWEKHPETMKSIALMQEQVFKVPYSLPSGRTVYLRGKWDGVLLREG